MAFPKNYFGLEAHGTDVRTELAAGIAFGFIAYLLMKALSGRVRDIPPPLWVISRLLALRYAFLK